MSISQAQSGPVIGGSGGSGGGGGAGGGGDGGGGGVGVEAAPQEDSAVSELEARLDNLRR